MGTNTSQLEWFGVKAWWVVGPCRTGTVACRCSLHRRCGFGCAFTSWCCGSQQSSTGSLQELVPLAQAGLGAQPGGVGGYLLSAAVEPTSHSLLFIGKWQWLGVNYWNFFICLLHKFCSLTRAGDLGIRQLPLWDRSNSGEHVPTPSQSRLYLVVYLVQATEKGGFMLRC